MDHRWPSVEESAKEKGGIAGSCSAVTALCENELVQDVELVEVEEVFILVDNLVFPYSKMYGFTADEIRDRFY